MSESVFVHGDIILEGLENLSIQKLVVCQEINQHATLEVLAIIKEDDEEEYRKRITLSDTVKVLTKNSKLIYSGLIINTKINKIQDLNYLHLTGMSHTYLMSIEPKSRSFQNIAMTYTDVINIVASQYQGGSCMDKVSGGATINRPIIQYREDDFSYIKRLASHFNSFLIPNLTGNGPRFYFGCPEIDKGEIIARNQTVHKDFSRYLELKPFIPNIMQLDFTVFEVETDEIYDLGDKVTFNGIDCYISKTRYQYDKNVIRNIVYLSQKRGMSQLYIPNNNIKGSSIYGKVIAVARDNVRIHLEIDETQDAATAYWYPYESIYASGGEVGFYCMPEIGDDIKLYHPDENELRASVTDAVKPHNPTENPERLNPQHPMANPNVKFLRTPFGKELRLRPNGVDIISRAGSVFMSLDDNGTLQINGNSRVALTAVNDIEIKAKNINFEALEQIEITAQGSKVDIQGDVKIEGNEINTN